MPTKTLKKIRANINYRLNQWHHWKEHPRINYAPYFHGVESPTAVILDSATTMTAGGGSTSYLRIHKRG